MMRLMTAAELTAVTESELCGLYRSVVQGLVLTQRNTVARRNALASLENIQLALNTRRAARPAPRP